MKHRSLAAFFAIALSFLSQPAAAQSCWPDVAGTRVDCGVPAMYLNGSNQAVPVTAAAPLPVTGTTTPTGTGANNADGVAAVGTGLQSSAVYPYWWNGATWDRAAGTAADGQQVFTKPTATATAGIAPSATQAVASNSVLKASAGNLYAITVTVGATAGWAMVFDATALPGNGATGATLKWCFPINSDGTKGGMDKTWNPPLVMATGITVGFSSTACNSLTASATAFFYGEVK